jgi:phosphoribosylanthranilate isomerase
MRVKICGVTTIDDALMCAEAGADLIGLNFYPKSPRCVTREVAAKIASTLHTLPKPPTLVGVFVNGTVETMIAVLDECTLDLAQMSGDESEEVVSTMGERGFKAIRITNDKWPLRVAYDRLVLFDAVVAGQYGGTGKTADWESAAGVAKRCRLLLAGGLAPENVAAAVRHVRPWGVDVASGVESAPGVKDSQKVKAFIRAAKQYDSNSQL